MVILTWMLGVTVFGLLIHFVWMCCFTSPAIEFRDEKSSL